MTTFATTAKPAWAVTAWCDDRWIFIELPCKDGPPFIQKFSLTEGGLSKALHLMKDARRKIAPNATYTLPEHPKLKRPARVTEEHRAKARDVLRKMRRE